MSDEEKVVSWFEENYKSLIFGVVIGLTLLFGYKSYLSSQNSAQLELSRQFDLAVTYFEMKDYDASKNILNYLIKESKDEEIKSLSSNLLSKINQE